MNGGTVMAGSSLRLLRGRQALVGSFARERRSLRLRALYQRQGSNGLLRSKRGRGQAVARLNRKIDSHPDHVLLGARPRLDFHPATIGTPRGTSGVSRRAPSSERRHLTTVHIHQALRQQSVRYSRNNAPCRAFLPTRCSLAARCLIHHRNYLRIGY